MLGVSGFSTVITIARFLSKLKSSFVCCISIKLFSKRVSLTFHLVPLSKAYYIFSHWKISVFLQSDCRVISRDSSDNCSHLTSWGCSIMLQTKLQIIEQNWIQSLFGSLSSFIWGVVDFMALQAEYELLKCHYLLRWHCKPLGEPYTF